MKKALICPSGVNEHGYRVAQVEQETFEVAEPLFWVDCADDVEQDKFFFDPQDNTIKPIPAPEPVNHTVDGAQTL